MSSSATPEAGVDTDQASDNTQYRLRVTAGPSYDPSTHKVVPVNAAKTLTFKTSHIILSLAVRIKKFTGFPQPCPKTSSYFQHPLHKSDQYSISFSFIPKVDIPGTDLMFGNDFDRPIRDRLPPGFNKALGIVKWFIDPGLEGDAYADKPYLYGPALSSWNILRIGEKTTAPEQTHTPDTSFHETVVEEGGDGSGGSLRTALFIPPDSAARKKYFLQESNRKTFTFEAGRLYQTDFGNPYLNFNDFSLKLPGFSLNVIRYIDSKTHELRYSLKNRTSGEVYVVVVFTLLFGEELVEVEREAREEGEARTADGSLEDAGGEPEPGEDDLD